MTFPYGSLGGFFSGFFLVLTPLGCYKAIRVKEQIPISHPAPWYVVCVMMIRPSLSTETIL